MYNVTKDFVEIYSNRTKSNLEHLMVMLISLDLLFGISIFTINVMFNLIAFIISLFLTIFVMLKYKKSIKKNNKVLEFKLTKENMELYYSNKRKGTVVIPNKKIKSVTRLDKVIVSINFINDNGQNKSLLFCPTGVSVPYFLEIVNAFLRQSKKEI